MEALADLRLLVEELESEGSESFAVVRVREECGGLRVYLSDVTDAILERIEAVQQEAFLTCVVCDQPGWRWENG